MRGLRHYGLATRLKDALAERGAEVSNTSIGRWLKGVHRPSPEHVRLICDMYGINQHWLETGHGAMVTDTATDEDGHPLNVTFRQLPILSPEDVPLWLEDGRAELLELSEKVVVAGSFSTHAFVLVLTDHAMSPRINRDSLLIIDPNRTLRGDLPALGVAEDGPKVGYPKDLPSGQVLLTPENPSYPPITLPNYAVVGPVIALAPKML